MKELFFLFLYMALLLFMVVWVGPVKTCEESGEYIADAEHEEIYYECNASLRPIELIYAVGIIFFKGLKTSKYALDKDRLYWECKTPKNTSYGFRRGNLISFRLSCNLSKNCSKSVAKSRLMYKYYLLARNELEGVVI